MIDAQKVIVAIDTQDPERLRSLFAALEGHRVWVKVGMELFYALGPGVVHAAKEKGFSVFLDLKLHDIPNTVGHALKSLSKLPFDMINVHAAGGLEMMKVARESTDRTLIAVTQLTSTGLEQMNREQRIPGSVADSVVAYAKLALAAGLNGVVSSPLEVELVKASCGSNFLTVTPGIRPAGSDHQDQKRITTPQEALRLGTDYMVIGRPITHAPNPREALEAMLK
jgi:orotidine-5'-phosphate decarboxylase